MDKALIKFVIKKNFNCVYKLFNPSFNEQENIILYGSNKILAGHFTLYVKLEGGIDPVTGMVFNHDKLTKVIDEHVIQKLHNKYLNEDLEDFKAVVPTLENLTVAIWKFLKEKINEKVLKSIKLVDIDGHYVKYNGKQKDDEDVIDFIF